MLKPKEKNEEDVLYILDHLRDEDKAECVAIHGDSYKSEVADSILNTNCNVIIGYDYNNDVPVCMGGVYQMPTDDKGVGIVMMLATDDIVNHQYSLIKGMIRLFKEYDKEYWFLYNMIYKSNNLAKKWLKYIGFKFDIPKPFGVNIPEGFEFFYRVKEYKGLI